MTCTGAFATKEEYSEFWGYWQHRIDITSLTPAELTALDNQLAMAAGDIHMAMQQQGACDCTLSVASTMYLKKLNIINTAVTYRVPCGPRLDDDQRDLWLQWLDRELGRIRDGSVDLCAGSTGKDFPAIGTAEIAWTHWAEADIIINDSMRRRSG